MIKLGKLHIVTPPGPGSLISDIYQSSRKQVISVLHTLPDNRKTETSPQFLNLILMPKQKKQEEKGK